MGASTEADVLEKLDGLARQASTEKSHYYVAATVGDAHREIVKLRAEVKRLKEYEWMYKDLCK